MTDTRLALDLFEEVLEDEEDDVDSFVKLLPEDVENVPKELLHCCVEKNALRCLEVLLEKYKNYPVNEATKKEKATALHLAAAFCPQEVGKYVITSGKGDDTDGCRQFDGLINGRMIDALLKAGADATLRDSGGDTPLNIFRRLRLMGGWENQLMLTPTRYGILPNTYYEKHTRIKKDLERVNKVLMDVSEKKASRQREKRKESETTPSTAASSSKKSKSND